MKKLLLCALLAFPVLGLFAQSLDKAKDYLKANKLTEAKAEIDKVVATPKFEKNAEAWFYKAKIYTAIGTNDQLKAQTPDALAQGFDAIQKYVQYDDKMLLLLMQEQYKPVIGIYEAYFQTGAAAYNSGKYQDALTDFDGAIEVIGYMGKKGWVKSSFDTTATLYAGVCAEKVNKRDEALLHYKAIVDSGITKVGGNDVMDLYKWVANYYVEKNDIPNAEIYLAKGAAKYPEDLYWADTDLDLARKSGNKDSLFSKYDQILKKYPDNNLFWYNYGVELYQTATDSSSGKVPANAADLETRAQAAVKKSLELKPDYAQANMMLGQIAYNEGVDLQNQAKAVKGSKPEDAKKRGDLRAASMKKMDEALPYFQKVDEELGSKGKLKMDDKRVLKDAYDLMITIYDLKGTKDKSDLYTNKFNNVDKDH